MHIELAKLRVVQRLLKSRRFGNVFSRLSRPWLFHRNIRKLFADPSFLGDEELDAMWTQLVEGNGRAVLPAVTRFVDERYKLWHRWIDAL